MPSLAGPKRPQDRIDLENVKQTFASLFSAPVKENGFAKRSEDLQKTYKTYDGTPLKSGDVLIAAITSCTNTSNPGVLLAAGLLAKKAVELGLKVKPHIKTSLAPGSRVVTEYLAKAGLLPYLEKLGFNVAAYGCTTCIGNAGPLAPPIEEAIVEERPRLRRGALGQPQFRSAHPSEHPRQLPRLAAAGRGVRPRRLGARRHEARAARHGEERQAGVHRPHLAERATRSTALMKLAMDAPTFRRLYADLADTNPLWKKVSAPCGQVYSWPAVHLYRRAAVLPATSP